MTVSTPAPDRRASGPRAALLWLGAALVLLAAAPAAAELVVFAHGDVLKVARAVSAGDTVTLDLATGGSLEVSLLTVERILDDEVADPRATVEAAAADGIDPFAYAGGTLPPEAPWGELIQAVARRNDLHPRLLAAIARAESAFDPRAVSVKGARGLLQLMPATALRFGVSPTELFDPERNLEAGARYVRWLAGRFEGDLEKVLAAYNAGEGMVDRYGGVPPFRETLGYVERVLRSIGVSR